MNRKERSLYSQYWRQGMQARGIMLAPDDDGVTFWMRLGDGLQAFFGSLFVIALCLMFFGFLGALMGAPGLGVLVGLIAGSLGLLAFHRRPPLGPLGRRIDALSIAEGNSGYDNRLAHSFQNAFGIVLAVAIWSGIGALAGLLFGLPQVGAVLAGGVILWNIVKDAANPEADYDPETHDHGGVFGTARPATLQEALNAGLSTDCSAGLFIGVWREWHAVKGRFGRVRQQLKTHWLAYRGKVSALVFAFPGGGKFTCSIAPTCLTNTNDGLIVVDPKREAASVTQAVLRQRGYKIVELNPLRLLMAGDEASGQINPLGALAVDDPLVEELVGQQAAILLPIRPGDKRFFSGGARDLGTALALHELETKGSAASWVGVNESLNQPEHLLNNTFGVMLNSRFASVRQVANRWHIRWVDGKPAGKLTDGAHDVINTARPELSFLGGGAMAHLFGTAAFSFEDMKHEKTAVFIVLPEGMGKAYAKAMELILASAKNALLRPPVAPVTIIIDEMCTSLDSSATDLIHTLFNLGRGFGVRVVGICQSWAQFVTWCGDATKAAALRAAAGCAIYYGANDPVSCEHIRKECGDKTIWAPNTSPTAGLGLNGSGLSAVGVPLLRDSDLRDMLLNGGQIVMLAGSGIPVLMPRTPYHEIAALNEAAAPNPYFQP